MDFGQHRVEMIHMLQRAVRENMSKAGVGLRHLMDPSLPNLAHVHTVVRTPNGNDYGRDLLRQHREQYAH